MLPSQEFSKGRHSSRSVENELEEPFGSTLGLLSLSNPEVTVMVEAASTLSAT